MNRPRVLYIGDCAGPEFSGPARWLADRAEVSFADDVTVTRAAATLHGAPSDLIVVAQVRPGEYSHATFESLRACAPLTPIVNLLSSLCEGETRTGKPWPGAVRVYAHQFAARVGRELLRMARVGASAWAIPHTATDEDRLLASPPLSVTRLNARVVLFSEDGAAGAAISDLLVDAGCTVTRMKTGIAAGEDADIAVWDCRAAFGASQASFARMAERSPHVPKIVLIGFPRADDDIAARMCGAAAIVSKPFLVDDLLWQMCECLDVAKPRGASNRPAPVR